MALVRTLLVVCFICGQVAAFVRPPSAKGAASGSRSDTTTCAGAESSESNEPLKTTVVVKSPDTMHKLGNKLGQTAAPGDVVLLNGEFGSGKSHLAKGFMQECLGTDRKLISSSPPYWLINTYPLSCGKTTLNHMDLYQTKGPRDLDVYQLPKLFQEGVNLVEWAERLEHLTPDTRLEVNISKACEATRAVTLVAHGESWEQTVTTALNELKDELE